MLFRSVYLPHRSSHPLDVFFGGGGGENYRPFYTTATPPFNLKFWKPRDPWSLFVASRSKAAPDPLLAKSVANMLHSSMDRLKDGADCQQDPLMLHYQNFRNRFHAGRVKQTQVHFSPLASSLVDDVARCAGKDRLQIAQFHYDLMFRSEERRVGKEC